MDDQEIMQSRNFEFLRDHWSELASLGGFAEQYCVDDPESALVKMRAFAERSVGIVYEELALPRAPMSNFMDLLSNDAFKSVTPKVVIDKFHAIRIHGNKAAHGEPSNTRISLWLIQETWDLGRWLFAVYRKGEIENLGAFIAPQDSSDNNAILKEEKKALLQKYSQQEAEMQALLELLEDERHLRDAAERSADQVKAAQSAAQTAAQSAAFKLHFNETTTRRRLIDTQLAGAKWDVGHEGTSTEQVGQEIEVLHQPTTTGIGKADYVLWDDNGKPLAVIEAKKTAVDAEQGRHQARLYADGLEKMHNQRPVVFYTNGYDIWIWDDHSAQKYPPRKIYGFYSKRSLQYLVRQRTTRKPFNTVSVKPLILTDRLYQHEALKLICERYESRHRRALAVQATGTGKTRLAIALSDVAMQAGWVKRVLFLCDRRELRKQARNAFLEFLPAPVTVLTSDSMEDDTNSIFLATYPAMVRIYERFDPGFFDLIIADESHRSIYNIYGDVFRYFDALQLGLTATPVEMVSRSTCKLFGCDFKQPTTNYSLERAVEEGYLVPYRVVKHTTRFLREGIKGNALTAEQVAELEDQGVDPNLLDFDGKDIDRAIYNKDTNRKILQNLMDHGIRQADEQTLGKSLVFARNHKHAKLLQGLFDEMYPQYAGQFCQVIDNYDPRAEQLIDDFKGKGENDQLTIAISVDMLDTGIDVPEIVNLVFARPVKSPVKFWQMVGRGTRLCKDLFGPAKDKKHFQIFDHWGVVEYHGMQQREITLSMAKPRMQQLFDARLNLARIALEKHEPEIFETMADWLLSSINGLNDNTIAVRDKWRERAQVSNEAVIKQFSPATVVALENEIAPLMKWLDIRGHADAYEFDLLITSMQLAKLRKETRYEDLLGSLLFWVNDLQLSLNQVKTKESLLRQVKQRKFWDDADVMEMERVRIDLRDIMKFRGTKQPSPDAPVIDVEDSGELRESQGTYIPAIDIQLYKSRIEEALKALFENTPVLKKVRKGEAVTPAELEQLNALVHTQNPDVDLSTLKNFYGSAAPMDQVLRSIIGMDAEVVNDKFAAFVQNNPGLSARQTQFLGLLKRQIQQSGAIELAKLYERPFSSLGDFDTLFSDKKQISELIDIVEKFGPSIEPRMSV